MLSIELDEVHGIVILEPNSALSRNDFESAAKVVDPFIDKVGRLKGLVIHTKSFPGWDSLAALVCHLRFVKEHHKHISRVAFSTDSVVGRVAEAIAGHFISAEIKSFTYHEFVSAKLWAAGDT